MADRTNPDTSEALIAQHLARRPDDSPEQIAAITGVDLDAVRRASIYLRVRVARAAGEGSRRHRRRVNSGPRDSH